MLNYYISNSKYNKKKYNDKKYTINKEIKKMMKQILKKNNSPFYKDENLINHLSYMCVRD